MARNILILKIISARHFNPDDQEDISFLWDVWYNAEWTEITRHKALKVLKELLDGILPKNVTVNQMNQLQSLKEVWTTWSSDITAANNQSELELLQEKIRIER